MIISWFQRFLHDFPSSSQTLLTPKCEVTIAQSSYQWDAFQEFNSPHDAFDAERLKSVISVEIEWMYFGDLKEINGSSMEEAIYPFQMEEERQEDLVCNSFSPIRIVLIIVCYNNTSYLDTGRWGRFLSGRFSMACNWKQSSEKYKRYRQYIIQRTRSRAWEILRTNDKEEL